LFAANCASCHGIGAEGSRDSYFPSLFHNSALAAGGGRNLVATILFGIDRTTFEGLAFMPGFGGKATDIAALGDQDPTTLDDHHGFRPVAEIFTRSGLAWARLATSFSFESDFEDIPQIRETFDAVIPQSWK
jgi:hypothetical protein